MKTPRPQRFPPIPARPSRPDPAPGPGVGFGVDIGGSGIKGAPVDLAGGRLLTDRFRIKTPRPSTPTAVAATVADVVARFDLPAETPLGVTFPAVVQHGVARSAANVDDAWVGTDIAEVVGAACGRRVVAFNDADAAGYAEARFGAARNEPGTVFFCTLGTGIGTVLIVDGTLVPNLELGHLVIDGVDAETRAADSARERENLSFSEYAERLQWYFDEIERLLWPDLIVVGGGVSKHATKFLPLLNLRAPVVPAQLRNAAGIVGVALLAAEHSS